MSYSCLPMLQSTLHTHAHSSLLPRPLFHTPFRRHHRLTIIAVLYNRCPRRSSYPIPNHCTYEHTNLDASHYSRTAYILLFIAWLQSLFASEESGIDFNSTIPSNRLIRKATIPIPLNIARLTTMSGPVSAPHSMRYHVYKRHYMLFYTPFFLLCSYFSKERLLVPDSKALSCSLCRCMTVRAFFTMLPECGNELGGKPVITDCRLLACTRSVDSCASS